MRARLASPLAKALDLPYPKAPSNEIVQRNAPHNEVTPCLDRRQLNASDGQLLKCFGLPQVEVVAAASRAREGTSSTLVAVPQQATSFDRLRLGHRPHWTFGLGGQCDQFDRADTLGSPTRFCASLRVVLREHESGTHSRVFLSVRLGDGIVHDAGGYTEEDRPGRGVAPEAKKVPWPLEGLGRSDGYEAEVSQGEPLTHVSFSCCRYLRQVNVEHVRNASSQGSFLAITCRYHLAISFQESSAAGTLATEEERYKVRREYRGIHWRDDSYYVAWDMLSFR